MPIAHDGVDWFLGFQVPPLRMAAHKKGQSCFGVKCQRLRPPCLGTDRGWRQIGTLAIAGKAKGHGQDGYFSAVVECLAVDPHPCPQPVPGRILKRNAGAMNPRTRRLTGNQDRRRCTQPDNGLGDMPGFSLGKTMAAKVAACDLVH